MKKAKQKSKKPISKVITNPNDKEYIEMREFFYQGKKDGYEFGISQQSEFIEIPMVTVCDAEHLVAILADITTAANVYPLEMFNGTVEIS